MKLHTIASKSIVVLTVIFCSCSSNKEVVERYPDGSIKKLILHMDKNNYKEEEYYENGNLKRETVFKNGVKDGVETQYCENGGKGGEMTYHNGVKAGIVHEFFRNGQLAFEGFNVNDKLEGLSTWYYRNGKMQEKGYRHLGVDTGRWVDYDTTGTLSRVVEYHRPGRNIYYNGAGIEISAEEWAKIPYIDQDRCQ